MYLNGACYIRVSTDDQTEFSPDAQLKAIKNYAKQNDIIITKEHIFIDEGISGKRADKRPEFMRMIATAKSKPKPFDIILVHKFDRFARSREDSVVYKSLLRKEADIKVVSITESIEDDKFSVILEAMLEAMAEYYSLNLAEEVKKGMTEKATRGEYQTTPAYGYDLIDKKLVIKQDEANIVKLIFTKMASREMNMRQLAVYINQLGIKTHRGKQFESRTIDYIINNPVYIGKVRWNPDGKLKRDFNKPSAIIAQGSHEPIVDMDTWEKVHAIIKETKEMYKRPERSINQKRTWLTGLIRCESCHRTMVANGNSSIVCNGYAKGTCNTSNRINYRELEKLVLQSIRDTFKDSLEINIIPRSDNGTLKNDYELLEVSIEKLVEKEKRVKIAYEDGIDTLEEYKENKKRITEEKENLKLKLNEIKQSLIQPQNESNTIYKRMENVYDLLTNSEIDIETKFKTSHFLIDEILFSKNEKTLKITYK